MSVFPLKKEQSKINKNKLFRGADDVHIHMFIHKSAKTVHI